MGRSSTYDGDSKPLMRASVIVPTFNRRDIVSRTLRTLCRQDFPAAEFEIIVVIDGSTDGTAEVLQPFSQMVRAFFNVSSRMPVADLGAEVLEGEVERQARRVLREDVAGVGKAREAVGGDKANLRRFVGCVGRHGAKV